MMRNMQEIQKRMLERELKDKDEEKGLAGGVEGCGDSQNCLVSHHGIMSMPPLT